MAIVDGNCAMFNVTKLIDFISLKLNLNFVITDWHISSDAWVKAELLDEHEFKNRTTFLSSKLEVLLGGCTGM